MNFFEGARRLALVVGVMIGAAGLYMAIEGASGKSTISLRLGDSEPKLLEGNVCDWSDLQTQYPIPGRDDDTTLYVTACLPGVSDARFADRKDELMAKAIGTRMTTETVSALRDLAYRNYWKSMARNLGYLFGVLCGYWGAVCTIGWIARGFTQQRSSAP